MVITQKCIIFWSTGKVSCERRGTCYVIGASEFSCFFSVNSVNSVNQPLFHQPLSPFGVSEIILILRNPCLFTAHFNII